VTRPAIACRNITVRFATPAGGVQTVIGDVSVEIADGTFVAIVGPSGCGKSTLLNLVAGLLQPQRGSVEVFGEALTGSRVARVVVPAAIVAGEALPVAWNTPPSSIGR